MLKIEIMPAKLFSFKIVNMRKLKYMISQNDSIEDRIPLRTQKYTNPLA